MPGNRIPECPVYRPTAEEFAEPGEYFRRILPQMEAYGMCKVVPPAGWTPQPWSGRQPQTEQGATDWRALSGNTQELCKALSGNTASGGELMVTPRVQQLQLA